MTRLTPIEPGLSRLSVNPDGSGHCLEGEPVNFAQLITRFPHLVGSYAGFVCYRDPAEPREIVAVRGWCAVRTGHVSFDALCEDLSDQLGFKEVA